MSELIFDRVETFLENGENGGYQLIFQLNSVSVNVLHKDKSKILLFRNELTLYRMTKF